VAQTKKSLRGRVETYVRNLRNADLATKKELEAVAKRYHGRTKDDLWEWFAELKSLARLRKSQEVKAGRYEDADAFEAALAALEDRVESVHLPSIDTTVEVRPASWLRIMKVEKHAWWSDRLLATSVALASDLLPDKPPDLPDLQDRVINEIATQRNGLFSEIIAPSPAPATEMVEWAELITPLEEGALMQAYHRTNYDLLAQLPTPRSKDGKRELPNHWAFIFEGLAWRERRAPIEIIRDRSLVSVVAATILEYIKAERLDKQTKGGKAGKYGIGVDEDDAMAALGINA
jgi:hypothetical protein